MINMPSVYLNMIIKQSLFRALKLVIKFKRHATIIHHHPLDEILLIKYPRRMWKKC